MIRNLGLSVRFGTDKCEDMTNEWGMSDATRSFRGLFFPLCSLSLEIKFIIPIACVFHGWFSWLFCWLWL